MSSIVRQKYVTCFLTMLNQENLIFIIGSPRSGSTLLQRMVGSHSKIFTHPEPHLITPLFYLGYYTNVDKAPYDHINAAQALREFCEELPNGENDYLEALRAYASTLYEKVLNASGKEFFLDKTPAYALVLPFLTKLYPQAKYIVLTRHPLAILHSVAHSFFAGDYKTAVETNPIIQRYIPAIGAFIHERPVPFVHIRYEDLVNEPEKQMQHICEHLRLSYEPETITYGQYKHISKSYGDPMSVEKHQRPVGDSIEKWVPDLLARPKVMAIARRSIASLDEDHLAAWGYPKEEIFAALSSGRASPTQTPLNIYRIKRQVLLHLRKNIHKNLFGKLIKKIRYYCDVLLRT
ncbi:MAG: sulfotransferase [Deltaproteobacteria bacterium]|nr:sulfotransferase [Deltaproteobacteria bacterium]